MNKMILITTLAALSFAGPAQAGFLGGGNGLLGANVGVSTGHISVLNGGVLNGNQVLNGVYVGNNSNILSGIGNGDILTDFGLDVLSKNSDQKKPRRHKRW